LIFNKTSPCDNKFLKKLACWISPAGHQVFQLSLR